MNGLTLLVLIALAIGVFIAYRMGTLRGRRDALATLPLRDAVTNVTPAPSPAPDTQAAAKPPRRAGRRRGPRRRTRRAPEKGAAGAQPCRGKRRAAACRDDRRSAASASSPTSPKTAAACCARCAQARADTARYRELVVDLENNALPPLLDGPNTFDDLKLIVGIGPVLERMLHRLGVATYRQIAHWSERDIDEIDAKLPEFPGRIRRDGWVTQARELHQSKYGETLPLR